jgi:hypothetical protein
MTNYTAPELLLVGAAQHLVLADCPINKAGYASGLQVQDGLPRVSCDEDVSPEGSEDDNPF